VLNYLIMIMTIMVHSKFLLCTVALMRRN